MLKARQDLVAQVNVMSNKAPQKITIGKGKILLMGQFCCFMLFPMT